MQIAYLEGLLSSVAKEFLNHVGDTFGNGLNLKHVDFDAAFMEVRRKVDNEAREARRAKPKAVPKNKDEKAAAMASAGGNEQDEEDGDDAKKRVADARAKLLARSGGATAKKDPVKEVKEDTKKKKGKEMRHWDGAEGKYNE